VLRFGLLEGKPPVLLDCDGSFFQPSERLAPYVGCVQMISLFYALEASVVPITGECITRAKFCLAGSQSLSRSKIAGVHVKTMIEALNFPDAAFHYVKRRIMLLCPTLMMANAPVCGACFKYYTMDPDQHTADTESNRSRESPSLISKQLINRQTVTRPKTSSAIRRSVPISLGHVPVVRGTLPVYRIGEITPSGLRVTQDRSTLQLESAKRVYKNPPFQRPSAVFMRPNSVKETRSTRQGPRRPV
jgi:hypothetical protein